MVSREFVACGVLVEEEEEEGVLGLVLVSWGLAFLFFFSRFFVLHFLGVSCELLAFHGS